MNHNRRLSQDTLLHVLSLSTDATAVYTGEELLIEMASDAMIAFWGKDKSVIGKTLGEAVPELEGQPFIALMQHVWRSGESYDGNNIAARLNVNGSLETFYFDFSYRAIKDKEGKTYCILHTAREVSDRVYASKKLKESRKKHRKVTKVLADLEARALSVLDTMAEGIVISDLQYRVIYANETALNIFGAKFKTAFWNDLRVEGKPLRQKDHPAYMATFARKKVVNYMVDLQDDNGYRLFLSINTAPLFDSKGELTGSVTTLTDITHLRKLNSQLQESDKRFRALVRQAPVAIMVLRGQQLIVDIANDAMLQLMNRTETISGLPLVEIIPEIADQPAMRIMYEVLHTGQSFYGEETPVLLMREGQMVTCYFNISYSPLYEDGQITGLLEVATEVTGLVEAQKSAEQSEEILSQAISSANIGTWTIEFATNRLFLSERSMVIHGLHTVEGLSPERWLEIVQPAYRNELSRAITMVYQTNERFSLEYMIDPPDAAAPVWLRTTGRAMLNRKREIIGISGTILDITEQKEMEQRKDDFISIASHELKTPITSLKASLELLDRLKTNAGSDIMTKMIVQAGKSMKKVSKLIDDLLDVGRMQKGELPLHKAPVNIGRLLNGCCNPVGLTWKNAMVIRGEMDLQVYADEYRIDQVLINLINNAVKYAPNSAEIIIDIHKQAEMAKISVIDQGPGIPQHKIPYLFDRYYRARSSGNYTSGLGLGLYICYEIVSRHGGEIGVESEVGKGSIFWFTLPLSS